MQDITEFRDAFVAKLGPPSSPDSLDAYLTTLLPATQTTEEDEYTEVHHILPRSVFPEHINATWNKTTILYGVHCLAHELLWCAYPTIGAFWRPTNFMKTQSEEMRVRLAKAMSIRAKAMWANIKSDPSKYEQWRKRQSDLMSVRMSPNHPAYTNMIGALKEYWAASPEKRQIQSETNTALWQTKEHREKTIAAQKAWNAIPENKARRKRTAQRMWQNEEFAVKTRAATAASNASLEKRERNRQTITKKWESDPAFATKMLAGLEERRKTRKSSSDAMKLIWADPARKAAMLAARKSRKTHEAN